MTDPDALQPSRPTIAIDGTESSSLSGGLLGLHAHEDVDGLSHCEAEFGNWGPSGTTTDFLYFDRSLLDFGRALEVRVGGSAVFKGLITGIEGRYPEGGSPTVSVLAEDRFQEMRMKRRTRTFANVTDDDIFTTVASDHGLTPDIGVSGPTYRVLAQLNQSDLAFMRERARCLDAELWVSGTTLHVQPRTSRTAPPLALTHGKELHEFRVLADLAHQATSIEVTGWDVAGKQAVVESAGTETLAAEAASGVSGASVLSNSLGDRAERIVDSAPQTSAEARARAQATMLRGARRFLVGHGTAASRADLRVGATVTLSRLGPLFDGDYYVTAATVRFDGSGGMLTDITVERPWLGAAR
jgi:phage protein D